jgi:hypothetical protein
MAISGRGDRDDEAGAGVAAEALLFDPRSPVRRGDRGLFFVREEDPERGDWSDVYAVRDRPNGTGFEPCFELPLGPRSEWSLRGRIPIAALRFEHHERVSYVTRGSLERALAGAGV